MIIFIIILIILFVVGIYMVYNTSNKENLPAFEHNCEIDYNMDGLKLPAGKIGIIGGYNLIKALVPIVKNPLVLTEISHYFVYQVLRRYAYIYIGTTKKGLYSKQTNVHAKILLYYNKDKFPNGYNLNFNTLKKWIRSKCSPFKISYGAVRGASKKGIANYLNIDYEKLVEDFGEIGNYSKFDTFNNWFVSENMDLAFSGRIYNELNSKIGIATIDNLSYTDKNYALYTNALLIATDYPENEKYFSTIEKNLIELTIKEPLIYFIKKL